MPEYIYQPLSVCVSILGNRFVYVRYDFIARFKALKSKGLKVGHIALEVRCPGI